MKITSIFVSMTMVAAIPAPQEGSVLGYLFKYFTPAAADFTHVNPAIDRMVSDSVGFPSHLSRALKKGKFSPKELADLVHPKDTIADSKKMLALVSPSDIKTRSWIQMQIDMIQHGQYVLPDSSYEWRVKSVKFDKFPEPHPFMVAIKRGAPIEHGESRLTPRVHKKMDVYTRKMVKVYELMEKQRFEEMQSELRTTKLDEWAKKLENAREAKAGVLPEKKSIARQETPAL